MSMMGKTQTDADSADQNENFGVNQQLRENDHQLAAPDGGGTGRFGGEYSVVSRSPCLS